MDYIRRWFDSLFVFNRDYDRAISPPVSAVGNFNKNLGGMFVRATIELTVYDSETFEVAEACEVASEEERTFLEAGIFGFLDIVLLTYYFPKEKIRITVNRIEVHPVGSNRWAFREAGKDAGRQIVDAWQKQRINRLALRDAPFGRS